MKELFHHNGTNDVKDFIASSMDYSSRSKQQFEALFNEELDSNFDEDIRASRDLIKDKIGHLKDILQEVHGDSVKKMDCSTIVATLIQTMNSLLAKESISVAICCSDTFFDLTLLLKECYTYQFNSLGVLTGSPIEIVEEDRLQGMVYWPFSMNTIENCSELQDVIEQFYESIKHDPLPVSVERMVLQSVEMLDSLKEWRQTMMDVLEPEIATLFYLDTVEYY